VKIERITPIDYIIPVEGTKLSYKCIATISAATEYGRTTDFTGRNIKFKFAKNRLFNTEEEIGCQYQRRKWKKFHTLSSGAVSRLGNNTCPWRTGKIVTRCYNNSCSTTGYQSSHITIEFNAHPDVTILYCDLFTHFTRHTIFRRIGIHP